MGDHIGMTAPSDEGPEREMMMGISLCRNSALRGIRRARIHAILRMTPFNEPTHHQTSMDQHQNSIQRYGHKGSEVRPSESLLLQKGNPGRNMTSLHHAAPPSLAPVALGDILVGGVLLISRKIEDMVASEHPVHSWKYALHMAALSSCKIYIIFRSDWWPMCVQGEYR